MDFWELYNDLVFLIMLAAAEVLVLHRSGKKKHFTLRFVLGLLPAALLSCFGNMIFANGLWQIASRYLAIFFCTFLMMALAYKGDFWSYLFTGIVAYCAQHIAYQSYSLLAVILGWDMTSIQTASRLGQVLLLSALCAAVYVMLYFILVRHLKKGEPVKVNNRVQILLSAIILLIVVYISFFGIIHAIGTGSYTLQVVVLLFPSLSCCLGLMESMSLVQLKQNETELAILRLMVHQAKYQYQESKESIELINIKCHDLRHQMLHLSGKLDREEVERLTQAVDIYDASLATGNDALDIVLMDKGLRCREKSIRLTCMFDADIVSGMKYSDIYALFGNAIENAMESVEHLDKDRRSISVVGYKQAGLSVIRVENYCQGEIPFENGLPVTQKSRDYHGFGVKSIRLIAQRYGGELTMRQNGDIFRMEIVFPAERPTRVA